MTGILQAKIKGLEGLTSLEAQGAAPQLPGSLFVATALQSSTSVTTLPSYRQTLLHLLL